MKLTKQKKTSKCFLTKFSIGFSVGKGFLWLFSFHFLVFKGHTNQLLNISFQGRTEVFWAGPTDTLVLQQPTKTNTNQFCFFGYYRILMTTDLNTTKRAISKTYFSILNFQRTALKHNSKDLSNFSVKEKNTVILDQVPPQQCFT